MPTNRKISYLIKKWASLVGVKDIRTVEKPRRDTPDFIGKFQIFFLNSEIRMGANYFHGRNTDFHSRNTDFTATTWRIWSNHQ